MQIKRKLAIKTLTDLILGKKMNCCFKTKGSCFVVELNDHLGKNHNCCSALLKGRKKENNLWLG